MIDVYLAPTANGLRATVALAECGFDYTAAQDRPGQGRNAHPRTS